MKKSAQVVMLPTNEKANLLLTGRNDLYYSSKLSDFLLKEDIDTFQHLYILSDEEIKEGDYHVAIRIVKTNGDKAIAFTDQEQLDAIAEIGGAKKIIATTDNTVKFPERFPSFVTLPQIPQSFIEKFVEEYNKGNVITEVMVEYKSIGAYANPKYDSDYQLKINPDNTIDISMPKDSWSREEVTTLLYSLNRDKEGNFDCTKWIEENL